MSKKRNHDPADPESAKPRLLYTLMLTHREVVACLAAIESCPVVILGQLRHDAKTAAEKLRALNQHPPGD